MSTIYVIDNTSGDLGITIAPGALNGPGSGHRDSDLRLYGMGALMWGEGVDENFLRLAETNAVLAKEDGDFLPGALGGTLPSNAEYLVATHQILPKDETDLGPGFGITTPLNGQLWFNDTSKTVYAYNKLINQWKDVATPFAGVSPPSGPVIGQLWFDTNLTNVCGYAELKVYNPTHPDAPADGFIGVGADYVSSCGDTMSGILEMSIDAGVTRHKITNLGDPSADYDAVHKLYVDTEVGSNGTALTNHINDSMLHLTVAQNTYLDTMESNCTGFGATLAADVCALAGYATNSGTVYTDVNEKINRAGDEMAGLLKLGPVGSPLVPTAFNDATTKQYVDNLVGGSLGNADRFVRYFTSNVGGQGQVDGDVYVSGSTIFTWAAGAWRQIFPAQYT